MSASKSSSGSFLSWVHFGDLNIRDAEDANYLDFLDLIDHPNAHLVDQVDFAFLPGVNAEDRWEAQYKLVRKALGRLRLPVYVIAGDYDRKTESLYSFSKPLQVDLYRAIDLRQFRLLFLNAMDGATADTFDFSAEQLEWLKAQLLGARTKNLRSLVFTHLYPSELLTKRKALSDLLREFGVLRVEMGHTHYNELANNGLIIYAATRSTGQVQEGPPGFSFTAIDDDVVSWKFKELGPWPFVMITSPAEEHLITQPESAHQVVRGTVPIRAKGWGCKAANAVTCSIDDGPEHAMEYAGGRWTVEWNCASVPDGSHCIVVRVREASVEAQDKVSVLVNQAGRDTPHSRSAVDYENTIGAHPGNAFWAPNLGPVKMARKDLGLPGVARRITPKLGPLPHNDPHSFSPWALCCYLGHFTRFYRARSDSPERMA